MGKEDDLVSPKHTPPTAEAIVEALNNPCDPQLRVQARKARLAKLPGENGADWLERLYPDPMG